MKKLDGNSFFMAFKNGAELVSNKKHHLNEINLFPVPDSDTGNNMTFTLKNIVYKVEPKNSIISTLKSIADNALESARGNSGLILAQFFSGLHSKAEKIKKDKNSLNTKDFTKIIKETIPYLYSNVDDPKDGTMLSVIRDWGEELHSLGENIDDFVVLFNNSMEAALKSLENTKTKLEILKKNNTVDAGAQGFIYFIEGMKNYWANPEEIAKYYDKILIISVSEALSGTGKAFKQAIKKIKEKKDLSISYLDSKLNSGAQGLLVEKAAKLINNGLSLNEIYEEIEEYRENTNILVNVNTIDYMVKGGRVSAMKGFLARIFNLKAIISLDVNGDGIIWDKAFSRKGVIKKILNEVKRVNEKNKIEKYNIVHAGAKEKAVELSKKIEKIVGYEPEYIVEIYSITTLNSGKETIAVSYLSK